MVLLIAAGWKLIFLVWDKFPFNSDEAIVALMARHILGGAKPLFFYGQSYMGSLDAWFVAAGFFVFGQHVWVIRVVQTLLYLGVVTTTIWITYLITGSKKSAIVSGIFLTIPTINVTLYTTVSLGGYNEALFIGNILIILAIEIRRKFQQGVKKSRWLWLVLLWGLFSGLGLWANALTLTYVMPSSIYLIWIWIKYRDKHTEKIRPVPTLIVILVGFLVGSMPFWVHGFQNGWDSLFKELLGSAIAIESGGFVQRAIYHIRNFILLGIPVVLGIRPPWEIRWLALPLIPFLLIAWGWLLWGVSKKNQIEPDYTAEKRLLSGIGTTLVLAFLFTSFGIDPSGRYFIPLYMIAAISIGLIFEKANKTNFSICVCIILVYNLATTFQCAIKDPPAITTQFYAPSIVDHSYDQELIEFLTQEGEYYGYTNYWVSYPLAFQTAEELIYTPRLPYHTNLSYTERDDRYTLYQQLVSQSERPAYITTGQTELETYLRVSFDSLGVTWKEESIGDYHVFYHLSRTVHPSDIGLGVNRN